MIMIRLGILKSTNLITSCRSELSHASTHNEQTNQASKTASTDLTNNHPLGLAPTACLGVPFAAANTDSMPFLDTAVHVLLGRTALSVITRMIHVVLHC